MSKKIGAQGEAIAQKYFVENGYEVLAQNYRYKRGEIDLIVKKENLIVFVEVKFRKNALFGQPETTLSPKQKKLILSAAENYIFETNWQSNIRFDILAILGNEQDFEITHLEDVFV